MTAPAPQVATDIAAGARRISVAPMMGCTDRHDRYLLRLITRRALLYTEMLSEQALIRGDHARLLAFDPAERPLALQIGGSDPEAMADGSEIAQAWGFDEININVGCPSKRVRAGRFGACLMAEPERVAACVAAMRARVGVPVTVKTRLGIDDRDSVAELFRFVEIVADAGCDTFIVHARKAWLDGLSPRENRTVPPLRYDWVYALKRQHPSLTVVVNGGVRTRADVHRHLGEGVDAVMIGREAYANPYSLAGVDQEFFGVKDASRTRRDILTAYMDYCERQLSAGCRLNLLTRHVIGLFQGQPNSRAWRRYLSEHAHRTGAGIEVIRAAAEHVCAPL
ncbi:MAG: tRNA dihydrouridine(20/20a) synthase DusA [Gammaproteobacteria bacterium]|nr:tRNA dihydrouridine(20/20a) synthase DusA [Gammaproteobacteria bacterium]